MKFHIIYLSVDKHRGRWWFIYVAHCVQTSNSPRLEHAISTLTRSTNSRTWTLVASMNSKAFLSVVGVPATTRSRGNGQYRVESGCRDSWRPWNATFVTSKQQLWAPTPESWGPSLLRCRFININCPTARGSRYIHASKNCPLTNIQSYHVDKNISGGSYSAWIRSVVFKSYTPKIRSGHVAVLENSWAMIPVSKRSSQTTSWILCPLLLLLLLIIRIGHILLNLV